MAMTFAGTTFLALRNMPLDVGLPQVAAILLIIMASMVLGLVCFYISFCCMSPPTYYLGLPFAWLYGSAAGETIVTLKSETGYLVQNFFHIPWRIHPWSLIASLNFWFTAGITLVILIGKRSHRAQAGCKVQEM